MFLNCQVFQDCPTNTLYTDKITFPNLTFVIMFFNCQVFHDCPTKTFYIDKITFSNLISKHFTKQHKNYVTQKKNSLTITVLIRRFFRLSYGQITATKCEYNSFFHIQWINEFITISLGWIHSKIQWHHLVYIDTFYYNGLRIKSLSTKFSGMGKFIIGLPPLQLTGTRPTKSFPSTCLDILLLGRTFDHCFFWGQKNYMWNNKNTCGVMSWQADLTTRYCFISPPTPIH
jgi:hypothetical protein